jgi:hypothetical protein
VSNSVKIWRSDSHELPKQSFGIPRNTRGVSYEYQKSKIFGIPKDYNGDFFMKATTKRKVKKRARTAVKIWRLIAATVIFLILVPTFLANHEGDHFFKIVLILSALVLGLLIIIKQPLKKRMRGYIDSGIKLLLVAAVLLIFASGVTAEELSSVRIGLLVLSSLFYSFALQRLGISYVVGIP